MCVKTPIQVILRGFVALLAAALLLTGCKSSHNAVKGGGNGKVVPGKGNKEIYRPAEDYAKAVADPTRKALIAEAQTWLGTPYLYGGDTRYGTDCSGLVMSVYQSVCGIKIPRTTRDQVKYCTKVARNKIQPGDLVFFASDKADEKVYHVGMYIGEGKMIHASTSRGVMVSAFDDGYWGERYFTGAKVDALAHASVVGKRPPQKNETVQPIAEPPVGVEPPAKALINLDIIDDIIDQKVDSIFSSQFMD